MLKVINNNELGSQPKIIPTNNPHVKLDYPSNTKRLFPKENKTQYPNFNKCPRVYSMKNEKPSKDNNYSNNFSSSMSKLTFHERNPFRLF